jgi:hypothetical protein
VTFLETFQEVLKKLEDNSLPYMIVGSLASMIYGEPRLTRDMDLVISISPIHTRLFKSMFPETEYYSPPHEILVQEIQNRGQFNIIHLATGLKIDFIICKTSEHAQEEFGRRTRLSLVEEMEVFVARVEDVMIKKLEYFREGGSQKHIGDIKGMIANSKIDQDYLSNWIKKLGLEKEWSLCIT